MLEEHNEGSKISFIRLLLVLLHRVPRRLDQAYDDAADLALALEVSLSYNPADI